MFYHISCIFDYEGFRKEASPLSRQFMDGYPETTYARVSSIVKDLAPEDYIFRYNSVLTTAPTALPLPDSLGERNRILGSWLMVILSTYLRAIPNYIGSYWGILDSGLSELGWPEEKRSLFFNGRPVGTLINRSAAETHRIPTNKSPFWEWVRLPYTYNQGGWLSLEDCQRFLEELKVLEAFVLKMEWLSFPKIQRPFRQEKFQEKYVTAINTLHAAVQVKLGLYMINSWSDKEDYEDED